MNKRIQTPSAISPGSQCGFCVGWCEMVWNFLECEPRPHEVRLCPLWVCRPGSVARSIARRLPMWVGRAVARFANRALEDDEKRPCLGRRGSERHHSTLAQPCSMGRSIPQDALTQRRTRRITNAQFGRRMPSHSSWPPQTGIHRLGVLRHWCARDPSEMRQEDPHRTGKRRDLGIYRCTHDWICI